MRKTPKIKDYRAKIKGKTERGFQGITIKTEEERENNRSQKTLVSEVSRVSSSPTRECLEKNNNIKKGKYIESITPDTSDTLDTETKKPFDVNKTFAQLQCFDCRRVLDENSYTFYQGKPFCFPCLNKLKDQEFFDRV